MSASGFAAEKYPSLLGQFSITDVWYNGRQGVSRLFPIVVNGVLVKVTNVSGQIHILDILGWIRAES